MTPFNNRWAALFLVATILLVAVALVGTDEGGGPLQRYAASLAGRGPSPDNGPVPVIGPDGAPMPGADVRHEPVEVIENTPPSYDEPSFDDDDSSGDPAEGLDPEPQDGRDPGFDPDMPTDDGA